MTKHNKHRDYDPLVQLENVPAAINDSAPGEATVTVCRVYDNVTGEPRLSVSIEFPDSRCSTAIVDDEQLAPLLDDD